VSQDELPDVVAMLRRIDARLDELYDLVLGQQMVKDYYTTAEVGQVLGKSEYTVREWARQGRVRAGKRACGRGRAKEWVISHEELTRLRNEGLLPLAQ
jgi:hypothetical protein